MSEAAAMLADDANATPSDPVEAPPTDNATTEAPATETPAAEVDPNTLVPESPEEYELPLPEGDDGAFAKTAAEWFKEAGLPKGQAQALAAKWNEFAAKQSAEMTAAQEASQQAAIARAEAQAKADDATLRNEWGSAYDANVELARRAVRQFSISEKTLNAIEQSDGYAGLLRMFSDIGKGLGEDTAVGLSGKGATRADLTAEQKLYPNMK